MFYLYDQHKLKALRNTPEEAIAIARFYDAILVTNAIEEAIHIAPYAKSAFLIYPKNALTLFTFWKYQLQYRTIDEFRIILYAAPKNFLYRFLALAAWISCGTYRLIPFNQKILK